ncbi:DNA polymerase IV [candidate division WWE3 bacterium CG09_land_8_20_14_0_10_47_33]|uniref:DNA polymerase IV n=1 Tax=candidate division WWE3 bacterium CG_4_9_14_0_2_um_filter_48_10 TaxID=1975078 RepID=A0A2M8EHU4_UNCKA|nr:DNA polymerase IV [bacterium]PIS12240.1 MAG: DNA polymerase IV [candidate division WWE3 bacterium CG09_land_8_20_14_0_10_47_33]PIZ40718.1 MAG: DNA polymerase IV [candidate division WWE3 bacterium CG_4_10_14_0_2_um_filter_47_8]PJC21847.1 MAG: DNA polymerase IV [candidate division WWE3 bacterium CG_4_9_14_0_2_um_filter_48_10]PJE52270.1 MAG: DNA polymerase IV [candidate division WWE3 bacterium CG10_big_fil_rev_8_21_14_0_10_48_23]
MVNRIVAHLDMDAFYAAIEERDNPQFSGKPIVVGADPKVRAAPEGGELRPTGRGVVSTANYEARKFGIKSAMPISQAYHLAPQAIFLQPDIEKYHRVSQEILSLLHLEVPLVEQASTDEFFLDLSHLGSYRKAADLAVKLKKLIREKQKLTATVGIGPNKLVAKIASGQSKPDGLTVVVPGVVLAFLAPLDIQEIPGIGPKTAQRFYTKKIKTVSDLRRLTKEELREIIGSFGSILSDLARGKDDTPVGEIQPIKSVGKQITFEKDTADPNLIAKALLDLSSEVWEEVIASKLRFETVTVTVRYQNFETHTKAETAKGGITELAQFKKIALKLLLPFLNRKREVRLVGVRLSR